MAAIQETKLTSAGAAREMAEQGHQCLEAECQKLRSTCSGKFPSILHYAFVLSSRLAVNQLFFLRITHEGALRSGGEGDHEPEDARDGQLAGHADRLRVGPLRGCARRLSRECLSITSPQRSSPPRGFLDL